MILPTTLNRVGAFGIGFLIGIGAQIVFRGMVLAAVGPVSVFFSSQTIALVAILFLPLLLSVIFLRIIPGSVSENLLRGFKFGSIVWFIPILVSTFA